MTSLSREQYGHQPRPFQESRVVWYLMSNTPDATHHSVFLYRHQRQLLWQQWIITTTSVSQLNDTLEEHIAEEFITLKTY